MKRLLLITLLLSQGQTANAFYYLYDRYNRIYGPYSGTCESYGRVSNFECRNAYKNWDANDHNKFKIDNKRLNDSITRTINEYPLGEN
jgi:hypothetical protein